MRSSFIAVFVMLASAASTAQPPRGPVSVSVPGGKQIYDRWCAACHNDGMPGAGAIAIKYAGQKPARIEQWTDLAPEMTEFVVRHGVGPMPRFRKTEITDAELKALSTYLATPAKGSSSPHR